jgi:Holliday junction resolvasome RuvABC DNA-binding subunit
MSLENPEYLENIINSVRGSIRHGEYRLKRIREIQEKSAPEMVSRLERDWAELNKEVQSAKEKLNQLQQRTKE